MSVSLNPTEVAEFRRFLQLFSEQGSPLVDEGWHRNLSREPDDGLSID
ncbi:hypothetical protein [Rosistilla carotiformis]|nr:hypothetical protein [Rosistilla carotiformis]